MSEIDLGAMTSPNQRQRPLALVTGASSGIGRELARLAARDGYDLIVVARRADRLAALATELSEFGATTESVVVDLAQPTGTRTVVEAVADRLVEVLVNDAGVGDRGRFATERQLAADLAMIQLNVTTLVELTRLLLPGMLDRDRGGILNVSSIAGYLPGPGQAVYNATKAFLKSFSQALSEETRNTGVRVTALCPGPVASEFEKVAGYPQRTEKSADESYVRRSGGRRWMAGVGCEQAGCGARSTDAGLQSLRVLPWQVIARASPGRHAVGRRLERIHAYAYFA
jgi:short-subunit dehydrogenase